MWSKISIFEENLDFLENFDFGIFHQTFNFCSNFLFLLKFCFLKFRCFPEFSLRIILAHNFVFFVAKKPLESITIFNSVEGLNPTLKIFWNIAKNELPNEQGPEICDANQQWSPETESGYLGSPTKEFPYDPNTNCFWTYKTDPNKVFLIEFSTIDLETNGCFFDFIEVTDGSQHLELGTLCRPVPEVCTSPTGQIVSNLQEVHIFSLILLFLTGTSCEGNTAEES